jgi:hypothetical protein
MTKFSGAVSESAKILVNKKKILTSNEANWPVDLIQHLK